MYTDVHCHLDFTTFGDLGGLIGRLADAGVDGLITVGFDARSSLLACEIAEKYNGVFFCAGLHPTELKGLKDGDFYTVEELCAHPKCVALGEIGLDYHYPDTDRQLQRVVFLEQLRLADKLKMPVQIHSRDCAEDMLELLRENRALISHGALLHCYSHSTESAAEFEKLGAYFSFGGSSTYKGAKKARRTIAALSEDRLLTETDSPYMPPASVYGSFPNTPLSIPEITANMAEARGVDGAYMAGKVRENAKRLFPKFKPESRGA